MAKEIGRDLVLSVGSPAAPIAGVRTKSLTVNNETIDFTDDDSDGWQELSTAVGQRSVTVSVSGVYDDDAVLDNALAADISETLTLTNAAGRSITGTFMITSYSESGEHTGEVTFEAEFTSSGVITKA
jgi:TP901-1 family phage major tail protein